VSSSRVPEELCDGKGNQGYRTQIAPWGSSFPLPAHPQDGGGGSRLGTEVFCPPAAVEGQGVKCSEGP